MRKIFSALAVLATLVLTAGCATFSAVEISESQYERAALVEDLGAFIDFVKATHPDVEYTASMSEIDETAGAVRATLSDGMTARETWMAMARMNPVFGDAHVGLRRAPEAIAALEDSPQTLFPAPVIISEGGAILYAGADLAAAGLQKGDEILAINGVSARDIVENLAPRMRGNSPALGRLIMARYFPHYFWTAYGAYDRYVLRVRHNGAMRSVALPQTIDEGAGEQSPFSVELVRDNVAYLNAPTFDLAEKDRFERFLIDAFAQIAAAGADTLIIDLRENGGGAHDVSDLLMAYLTDQPFSSISKVTARITEENINRIPGATLGGVVTLPFRQTITPPAELENRFDGDVYVLIGALTYSQAIAFAATAQDYGLATIAGEETEGPANQTGQVQSFKLPNTGFEALAPIYIFTRASGDTSNRGVVPDIAIENDPLAPRASIDALLDHLDANAAR